MIIGMGIINVISTSKIKKITAIKKNCIENGRREALFGSYPHSNAEAFSREFLFFDEIVEFKIIKTVDRTSVKIIIKRIIFPHKGLFNWKLNLLFIIEIY